MRRHYSYSSIARLLVWLPLIFLLATPLTAQEAEPGQITKLSCQVPEDLALPKWSKPPTDETLLSKTYHYRVYLPESYATDPDRHYPCMFISSPGGNAKPGAFGNRMRSEEWITIMLVESRNKSAEWLPNFLAAHDDAVKRFRIQEGMKFATGFSGGARAASYQVGTRPGFAGLILQGGDFFYQDKVQKFNSIEDYPHIVVALIVGRQDGARYIAENTRRDVAHLVDYNSYWFDGGHAWAPEPTLNEALDSMLATMLNKELTPDVFSTLVSMNLSLKTEQEHSYLRWEKLARIETSAEAFTGSNPKISAILQDITTEKQKIESSLDLSDEKSAKEAFLKIQEKEQELMADFEEDPDMKTSKKNRKLQRLIDDYIKSGEYHPETAYGQKSMAAAEQLKTKLAKKS